MITRASTKGGKEKRKKKKEVGYEAACLAGWMDGSEGGTVGRKGGERTVANEWMHGWKEG